MKYKDYTGPFGKPLKPLTGPIEDYLEGLRRVFKTFGEVKIVYIFGSHAKGFLRKTSDVDIAVLAPDIGWIGIKNCGAPRGIFYPLNVSILLSLMKNLFLFGSR